MGNFNDYDVHTRVKNEANILSDFTLWLLNFEEEQIMKGIAVNESDKNDVWKELGGVLDDGAILLQKRRGFTAETTWLCLPMALFE